jgi:hypothetical protein
MSLNGAEHPRHAEAPHVRVQDADRAAGPRQRGREVHRDARLADAALPRRDRHDRRRGREGDLGLGGGLTAAQLGDEPLTLLRAHRRELDLDALDVLERAERFRHVRRDPILQRAALDREEHVDADEATVDLDRPEHPDLGIPDVLEGLSDLRFRRHGRSSRAAGSVVGPRPLGV